MEICLDTPQCFNAEIYAQEAGFTASEEDKVNYGQLVLRALFRTWTHERRKQCSVSIEQQNKQELKEPTPPQDEKKKQDKKVQETTNSTEQQQESQTAPAENAPNEPQQEQSEPTQEAQKDETQQPATTTTTTEQDHDPSPEQTMASLTQVEIGRIEFIEDEDSEKPKLTLPDSIPIIIHHHRGSFTACPVKKRIQGNNIYF